jgi:hypothetical protein
MQELPLGAAVPARMAKADVEDHSCFASERRRCAPLRVFRPTGRSLSVTLCGSLQIKRHVLKQEKQMGTTESNNSIKDDVLHLGTETKLTAEQIAKAQAHHDRHHHGDQPQQAAAKTAPGKKNK